MIEGTLVVNNKNLQVKFINKNGKEVSMNAKESELSASILAKKKTVIAQLNGLEVELEEVGGQPKQIREKEEKWESPNLQSSAQKTQKNQNNYQKQTTSNKAIRPVTQANIKGEFHNPYNFIPAPPRNIEHSDLGDHLPAGHGSYRQNYWSGKIAVKLTTITPLLIPDAANFTEGENQHKTYPIRVDAEGKPYLPATSIKGMLRSAYEAVTNSRFGIFEKHEDRLAYRMSTQLGLQMIPARIDNNHIYLYTGTSGVSNNGKPRQGDPMYAAWLERYDQKSDKVSSFAVRYPDNSLPQHGQKITAWIEKYEKTKSNGKVIFSYWKVRKIVPFGQSIGRQPQSDNSNGFHQSTGEMKKIDGFVCMTNKNIDNKHDERVFFTTELPIQIELTSDIIKKWTGLISNYQEIHEDEIKNNKNCPPALNHSRWSRHIKGGQAEKSLSDGTLGYAHVQKIDNEYKILGLYPVMISRELYEKPPQDLLDPSLKPANSIDELSPADRVFGWVKQDSKKTNNQKGATSYKGNLRIFNVRDLRFDNLPVRFWLLLLQMDCLAGILFLHDSIEEFGEQGFPLAILGKPNEQQARFYLAKDKQGTSLDSVDKEKGYSDKEQGLRGRKVYPHHNGLPDDHWHDPNTYRTEANKGHYQEYRQPSGEDETTDQNRSIQAWVKPEVEFSFIIDLINLSSVELGALLWLLSLEDNHYHRLGGGKPLGFGSVKLSINWDKTDLRKGQDWKTYYSSLTPVECLEKLNEQVSKSLIQNFQKAVIEAYGNSEDFSQVSFIKAFITTAKGFDDKLPIHYPRITKEPNPNGEGFDWFVANESVNKTEGGLKLSLPCLSQDQGFPLNPTQPTS